MNEFDQKIRSAKRRNMTLYLVFGVIAGALSLLYVLFLLLARGYDLVILPKETQTTAFVTVEDGMGFVLGEKVYAFSSAVSIQVGAKLYQSRNLLLTSETARVVEVQLEPALATLEATAADGSAETLWLLDDELVGLGTRLEYELKPGSYQLRVNDPYRQPQTLEFTVQKGELRQLTLDLAPFSTSMSLNTRPQGAEIFLDGQSIGHSPLELEKSGGLYQLDAKLEGFEPLTEALKLTNEQPHVSREYWLEPVKVKLTVSAEPSGGLLLIDGQEVEAGTHLISANQGHVVRYRKPGYFPMSKKLVLKPGQDQPLHLKLKRETGKLVVKTTPSASLYLNDKKQESSNTELTLPALPQKLEFRKPGYRSVTRTVTPSSAQTQQVKVNLLTEFDARRKEGSPLFISGLGIEMAQFKPGALVMGSPANEKGRRRNEFEVKVDLTRPFWVSLHEVTEAQYGKFRPGQANTSLPVTNVSWNDAALFCNWLSQQEGLPHFYRVNNGEVVGFNPQAKGYRLLTEAEWEWLAKKGKRSTETRYVWGNQERIPRKSGNYGDKSLKGKQIFYLKDYDDGFTGKAPVGSFRADRLGLYDLAGNVAEWVNDYYTNRPPDLTRRYRDYTGAIKGSGHVAKGGHYQAGRMLELRAAYREPPEEQSDTLGFRIARYQ